MSSLTVEEDQKWLPTHVQVTVLRGRGLRGKGKHGTSDVYTIIQLGKEKYSTGVAEKTTEPEWKEECSFELQPGVLDRGGGGGGGGGRSGYPAGSNELILTVMHRALIGMDVFLGQAVIYLDKVFYESRCVKNEWYRLNSKTGKKEKERGDIQMSVQFTRNNLTASMYDLVMKDKSASTFSKLKEHMKGKRRSNDKDSSSAILPGGYGSLYRMRQRLPSDGGGEEDYEDDEGGEARRSKMRTFFLRGKLRKSSDTRSSTSLGSESSESSSRGGSLSPTAGISVVVSDLSNSPSNSSNLTADNSPEHTANTSPKSSSLKCEFSDEAGEITIAVPQPTVCVNGSHAYNVQPLDPGSGIPAGSLGLGLLQKSLPLSMSLQNLSLRASTDLPKGPMGDGRRWSFDKPGEEEKAAIAAALEKSGPMLSEEEERLGQDALSKAASSSSASTAESEIQGKKQKRNLFSHGKSESSRKGQSQSKDESEQAPAATDEKHRGWFGSKDSHSKPSLVVSLKLPSTDLHPPPLPPNHHPSGPSVDPASVVSTLHHTNPFCHSQTSPPPISLCNPFFSLLQHNPFYEDMLTTQHLKPSLPPLPYLSSSRPPIAELFPQPSNPYSVPTGEYQAPEDSVIGADANSKVMAKVRKRPDPPAPAEGQKPLLKKSSNPFMPVKELALDSEWDESFEAFAAGRLQSPEDLTTDCKMQQNTSSDHPLEHCNNQEVLLPTVDADGNKNVNDALCHQSFLSHAHKVTSEVINPNVYHIDTFPLVLETIPEHRSFESDNTISNTSTDSPKLDACTETKLDTSTTKDLTDTFMHKDPCESSSVQLSSSSPDPSSSGLGSSPEEDFLSCLSSHSDKLSASSSEETESSTLGFEKSSESAVVKKPSESEDDIADSSNDLLLVDAAHQTVVRHGDSDEEKVDLSSSDMSLALHSQVHSHPHPVITTKETVTEGADTPTLNISNAPDLFPKLSEPQPKSIISSQSNDESRDPSIDAANVSIVGFPEDLINSSVNTDVMIPTTPDEKLAFILPSFCITASSPGAKQHLLNTSFEGASFGGPDASQDFHGLFSGFSSFSINHTANSPSLEDVGHTLLHAHISNQSSSSFHQNLDISSDSQDYQTCNSQPSSKCSSDLEPNERLHSAHSVFCGDLSEIKTATALGLADSTNTTGSSNRKISQSDGFGETIHEVQYKTVTPEPNITVGTLPPAVTDADTGLIEREGENLYVVLGDEFSKSPQSQNATLHRSQSEGTLASALDEHVLSSFGSDPGAIQESSSAQPGPDLPSLISLAPSLTPESSSTPVALCTLSPFANASARLPSSAAQVAMPMPQETEQQQQQQAANQQNSPHPVKPLTTAMLTEEKRSVLATGLEKLKSTINPGRSSQLTEQEADRKKSLTEGAGSYYHLTHSELVALLVQREAELERQKSEFERQKLLLAKREVELRKLKPQVRDLEDYIDTLLVRIMEQKPTLLQVRSKFK